MENRTNNAAPLGDKFTRDLRETLARLAEEEKRAVEARTRFDEESG